jgi:hypothetical protein
MVQVDRVSWLLPELSERELCVHGITEVPSNEVLRDANTLYQAALALMPVEGTAGTSNSSTIAAMIQVRSERGGVQAKRH